MLAYHFLPAEHALDGIKNRRIKISEIDQLNDPFELWCVWQRDPLLRQALRAVKQEFCSKFGLVCFCKEWTSPLLWSHYADKHRGVCLGFEVASAVLKPIKYVSDRPKLSIPIPANAGDILIFTKYAGWKYEQELRGYAPLEERDAKTGLYFHPFDEKIALREVIAGPLCKIGEETFRSALAIYTRDEVKLTKARLSFGKFEVVTNERGFTSPLE